MGCNCGGGKGRTISQARRGKAAGAMPVGYSADRPLVLGGTQTGELPRTVGELVEMTEPAEGEVLEPIRIRVIRPAAGLKLGQAAWVTGPGVAAHLDSGAFVEITNRAQKRRQWRVGAFTYTDLDKARRVAEAQGTTPVEIA